MTDFPKTPGAFLPPTPARPTHLAPLPPRLAPPAPVAQTAPAPAAPVAPLAPPAPVHPHADPAPNIIPEREAAPVEEVVEETASEKQKREIKKAWKSNMFMFGSNREARRLGLYLNEGEEVLLIASGSRKDERGRGLVVATDRRVLFIWDGWVFRTEQDFQYETISSVEFNTGIIFGVFTVYGLGDEVSYNWVDRFVGRKMTRLIRQKVMEAKHDQG